MLAKKLTVEFLGGASKLLEEAQEISIASAHLSDSAFDIVERNSKKCNSLRILIGIHLPSSVAALEKVLELQGNSKIECRIFTDKFFHPKLYLFEGKGLHRAFIGSGNLTIGGLSTNIELFHRIDSQDEFKVYKEWYNEHYSHGIILSKEHINTLRGFFIKKQLSEQEDQKETKLLTDIINGKFNLDAIDFVGQFFVKSDHETFSPSNKIKEDDPFVDQLRNSVRNKLYDLHDLIYPRIQEKGWDLHPHYLTDDIVSKTELSFHHSNEIGAMWLHYGRDKKEIKRYGGENETPLYYARIQVIIHYDNVGIWLRFGKSGGSRQDRDYFSSNMKSSDYRKRCWDLIQGIREDYWISIGEESTEISKFQSVEEFWEFTKKDKWQTDYFIIGRTFKSGDRRLSEFEIVDTIMIEFQKLYPLYRHMKDKSFEK